MRCAKEKETEMSSIGSILNSVNSSILSEISSFNTTANQTANTSSSSSTASSTDTVDFSQVGKVFQELKQLQTTNPSEFKQVLTDAATKLQAAAQQQTDPTQASFLNNLASRFQEAANTGNLSPLQQNSSGSYAPRGHHHHHGGGGGSENNSTQDVLSTLLGNTQSTSSITNPQTNS
jgi:hypothetical protein